MDSSEAEKGYVFEHYESPEITMRKQMLQSLEREYQAAGNEDFWGRKTGVRPSVTKEIAETTREINELRATIVADVVYKAVRRGNRHFKKQITIRQTSRH